jgi:hypothetical protein
MKRPDAHLCPVSSPETPETIGQISGKKPSIPAAFQ